MRVGRPPPPAGSRPGGSSHACRMSALPIYQCTVEQHTLHPQHCYSDMGKFKNSKSKSKFQEWSRLTDPAARSARTRLAEERNVDHLHAKLHQQAERIMTLRADLDRQREGEKEVRTRLFHAEADRSAVMKENKNLRRRIARNLKLQSQMTAEYVDSGESDSSSEDDTYEPETGAEDEEEAHLEPKKTRQRRKCGRYPKASQIRADKVGLGAHQQYNRRAAILLYEELNKIYGTAWQNVYSNVTATDPVTDRGAIALRLNLLKLFNECPVLWKQILSDRLVAAQVEEGAASSLRKHWDSKALQLLSRCGLTQDGWQVLINLLSHKYNPKTEEFERVKFPGGVEVPLMTSLAAVLKQRDEVADRLGVTSTDTATCFDVRKALKHRLEELDDMGMLALSPLYPDQPTLVCQLLADATRIFTSSNTQGTAVVFKPEFDDSAVIEEGKTMNYVHNLVMLALYSKDDSYEAMCAEIPGVRQKVADIMRDGLTVNGTHYRIIVPLGGDLKLLCALLGLAGGSSKFTCPYCEVGTKEYNLCKADWELRGGLPMRCMHRIMRMQHFPEAERFHCPAAGCNKEIKPSDGYPKQATTMGNSARLAEQRKHRGLVPGRLPFLPVDMGFYILDVLHLILRMVPQLFRQTVQANCDPGALSVVAQWCSDDLDIIISDTVALQTSTGEKKLSVSAETWPGETCRKLLDNYETVLKLAIPTWETTHALEYGKCYTTWSCFFYVVTLIGEGCAQDAAARAQHGTDLDAAGAQFLSSYIDVASVEALKSPYLHLAACHLGDLARQWGSLSRWSSQPAEAIHQWVKFNAKHRSNRKGWVKTTAVSVAVKHKFANEPARRTVKAKQTSKFGHKTKAAIAAREETKAEVLEEEEARKQVAAAAKQAVGATKKRKKTDKAENKKKKKKHMNKD